MVWWNGILFSVKMFKLRESAHTHNAIVGSVVVARRSLILNPAPHPDQPGGFMDPSQYHQEYRAYMEFALQRFLIEQRGFTEYDAKTKVMQDFEEVEREARAAGYL